MLFSSKPHSPVKAVSPLRQGSPIKDEVVDEGQVKTESAPGELNQMNDELAKIEEQIRQQQEQMERE